MHMAKLDGLGIHEDLTRVIKSQTSMTHDVHARSGACMPMRAAAAPCGICEQNWRAVQLLRKLLTPWTNVSSFRSIYTAQHHCSCAHHAKNEMGLTVSRTRAASITATDVSQLSKPAPSTQGQFACI